jgi:hypothetical protein
VFMIGFPLLIIPLAIYNIVAFILNLGPADWNTRLFTFRMVSGADWVMTWSDAIIILALVMLFFEIIKATRTTTKSIIDHMLSTVLFIAALIEFLLVGKAATSTFFILLVICLVDVIGGYTVSIRSAQRAYSVEKAEVV